MELLCSMFHRAPLTYPWSASAILSSFFSGFRKTKIHMLMQNDNVKRSAHTIMTLLRICQASCFCHLISSLVKPTLWATPLNIKKTVGKAKQSSADAVPLQSATMDQLYLLDHDVKPVLSSCSEDHCGKCALILRSLIWLTEKGTPPCGCDDP